MGRRLIRCFTLVALSMVPAVSSADPIVSTSPAVYDIVDAVEVQGNRINITGIIAGESAPSEFSYAIFDGSASGTTPEGANRCDRLALLTIAKPGKYQFAITRTPNLSSRMSCKLIVRTP